MGWPDCDPAAPAGICFPLSGPLPKANKPGWENEGDSLEKEVARPSGSISGSSELPLARAPCGDPPPPQAESQSSR